MSNASNTVTILTQPTREDSRQVIEFSFSGKPEINLKSNMWALLGAALCFAASAALHSFEMDDISVLFFSVSISIATFALFLGLGKLLTAHIAYRVAQKQKYHILQQLQNTPHPDIIKIFVFDEESFTVIVDRERFSVPYSELHLIEEHSDCLLIEYHNTAYLPSEASAISAVYQAIPSRFVSTNNYLALTVILREHCPNYRVIEPMCTPDTPQQVEHPVQPEPLALAEYLLTDEEKSQAVELSPSYFPGSSPLRIKAVIQNDLNSFNDLRVVLYNDCVVLRFAGQDQRYFYGELQKAADCGSFILISSNSNMWIYPVPVRALVNKDTFLHILSANIEADREGALQADVQRLDQQDTPVIGTADMKAGRTLLRAKFDGKDILYRRRLGVTELIIDGMIYAQSKKIIERAHNLTAWVDGIEYNAFLNASDQCSYLTAGSRTLKRKTRWI